MTYFSRTGQQIIFATGYGQFVDARTDGTEEQFLQAKGTQVDMKNVLNFLVLF